MPNRSKAIDKIKKLANDFDKQHTPISWFSDLETNLPNESVFIINECWRDMLNDRMIDFKNKYNLKDAEVRAIKKKLMDRYGVKIRKR